jgi:hypothetical protein
MVVILPPDNVAGDIAKLQMELFRTEHLISSQALPPVMPLIWAQPDTPDTVARADVMRSLPPVGVSPPVCRDAAVLAPVSLADGWSDWIESLESWRSSPADVTPGLLSSCGEGFFVCECEAGPVRVPQADWPSRTLTSIVVARVTVTFGYANRPWEHVDWQVGWKVFAKLRG